MIDVLVEPHVDPFAERERAAKLVEALITEAPYRNRPWARMALSTAARAIRRGRHLTAAEKVRNLADAARERP